jgi:transcriptional antiterminator RfaH
MERTASRFSNVTDDFELAWYCLRSQPKHEHIAAAHLRSLEGVVVYSPRIRFRRVTRQGLVWVTEAMFPGYLFARFNLATMHRRVAHAHGVSCIVRFADRYPTIEDEVISQLQECAGGAEVTQLDYGVSAGDDVKIVEGAFAGLEAVVTQVMPARERIKVLMDFLGRKIEAEVECSSVLAQAAHPLAA